MYYLVLIILCIILFILFIIIYKQKKEMEIQKKINKNLFKDNNILINIDKHYINYLKNGYLLKKYKGKILLGDYDKFSMSNTISVINSLGYDIDCVKSAEDILFKLKDNKYDYIITNYLYKEGIDGIELCNIIKNELKIEIPIIILSSTSDMTDEFKIADYYIEKPLTKDKLKKIFNNK